MQYAEWTEDDAAGGVPEAGVLQLLRDLNLLVQSRGSVHYASANLSPATDWYALAALIGPQAGIPEGGEEAYVHEVMLRADVVRGADSSSSSSRPG